MDKIIEKPFLQPKKKISLDIEGSLLEMVDKLAELTNTSRTAIIETTIGKGYPLLLDNLKTSWTTLLTQDLPEEKNKKIKDLLKKLEKLIIVNPKDED